ncbi:hypothetical protein [Geitlerinema sp. PCC 9228]|uniref:hypothetical protein n=1 Tax=Geitlerinema sp. PCC 9228 TaxID=111611 RepID=UPI001114C9AE|nr:hypothetical protein [Geitlerinema sp. PCC 9228]
MGTNLPTRIASLSSQATAIDREQLVCHRLHEIPFSRLDGIEWPWGGWRSPTNLPQVFPYRP